MDPWVVQVLREGYQIPLLTSPPLSEVPIHLPSYSPSSIKGKALVSEINLLLAKGAIEPAPPSPGFYSRLFVVLKASGSWRPVIDLSTFNKFVRGTKFRMETNQSVLSSVRKDDWMVSVDLKDAYLQVPIHPNSRKYLRFVSPTGVFQFRSLCFGLTTAPQVFTRVMAPVSSILHSLGVRMLRYLDDWLIQASSREQCLWARDTVLSLCQELGVIVNLEKSNLSPSQTSTYLGIDINSRTLTASPTLERRERLLWIIEEFLSSEGQPAEIWRRLLGHLASLIQIVRGGRLRMRSLQIVLRQQWDFVNDQMVIEWSPQCKADLLWWNDMSRLSQGVSLLQIQPDLQMWTDSSDLGWGAHLVSTPVSGRWSEKESPHPINWKELRAIHLGLRHFSHLLEGQAVAVFCDNATAIAYLRNQGGTFSSQLNQEAQEILRWAESKRITLLPQFIPGRHNVLADALSRRNQVIGSEWTLTQEVVDKLLRHWPATVDLFATSLNHRLPVYFSPLRDLMSAGTDALLQSWDNMRAYAFPPFALVRQVLNKVRNSHNLELTLIAPLWPQKEWFPDLLELLMDPPFCLPERKDLLRQPHFHRFHLNPRVLHLHAWRLSNDLRDTKATLEEWLSRYPLLAGRALT